MKLLIPFAPHLANECLEYLNCKHSSLTRIKSFCKYAISSFNAKFSRSKRVDFVDLVCKYLISCFNFKISSLYDLISPGILFSLRSFLEYCMEHN